MLAVADAPNSTTVSISSESLKKRKSENDLLDNLAPNKWRGYAVKIGACIESFKNCIRELYNTEVINSIAINVFLNYLQSVIARLQCLVVYPPCSGGGAARTHV